MIGAIIGDIAGSIYEFNPTKTKNFELLGDSNFFTDDTIMTMAVFSALEKCKENYHFLSDITAQEFVRFYKKYPNNYGAGFKNWCKLSSSMGTQPPYNSFGNGSAMRVSPVAYFADSLEHCKDLSSKVTKITHNHPEGMKGAEATAAAIFLALNGKTQQEIGEYIKQNYYPLEKSCAEIRENYKFHPSCQKTVPESIQAFLEATSFEDAIKTTISLGGDADTMGAITGSLAEAYFGIPKEIEQKTFTYLDNFTTPIAKRIIEKRNKLTKNSQSQSSM